MKRSKRLIFASFVISLALLSVGCDSSALAGNKESENVMSTPVKYVVLLNGQDFNLQSYSINGSDYFKLRDIAMILNGTKKQFQVEWDSINRSVKITTDKPYTEIGGELEITDTSKAVASLSMSTVYTDGNKTLYIAYCINGNNYIKLMDIADKMDFTADIDAKNSKVSISKAESLQSNDGYVLTLLADSDEALLNGESAPLSTPPFIQNGIFYMPLEAVTKLLGGTYSFENDIVTIELSGSTTKYQIGSHFIIVNGDTYEISGLREYFNPSHDYVAVDENYAPLISNDTVFIPVNFTSKCYPSNGKAGIASAREYPDSRMAIVGEFENERGVNEVKLMDFYDSLPETTKSQLKPAGVVGEVINYSIEEYKNDDLQVYVMRIKEPYEDMESMDGRVCAINVVGNGYSTPRGLKTGDSKDRAWLLYGYERFTGSFSYTVVGELVTSFNFYTRYYGSQFSETN